MIANERAGRGRLVTLPYAEQASSTGVDSLSWFGSNKLEP